MEPKPEDTAIVRYDFIPHLRMTEDQVEVARSLSFEQAIALEYYARIAAAAHNCDTVTPHECLVAINTFETMYRRLVRVAKDHVPAMVEVRRALLGMNILAAARRIINAERAQETQGDPAHD